jgi:hypothetical protein
MNNEDILSTMTLVDWKAYNAEAVPDWIRGLASADPKERFISYQLLEGRLIYYKVGWETFDQGYGISIILASDLQLKTLPFLIALLELENVEGKKDILGLLEYFATFGNMNPEGEIYAKRAEDLRNAVWKERKTYIKFLQSDDAKLRLYAFGLLCLFKEHINEIANLIISAMYIESIDEIKYRMYLCFRSYYGNNLNLPSEELRQLQEIEEFINKKSKTEF